MMSLYMPRLWICIYGKVTKSAVLAKNTVDLLFFFENIHVLPRITYICIYKFTKTSIGRFSTTHLSYECEPAF